MPVPAPVALTAEQAQWVQGPLSIVVGTCGALGRPHVARAVGCSVGADGAGMSVLLQASTAVHALDDLRGNARVGVVFCDPLTSRSLQVKGRVQGIASAGAGGQELAQLWVRGFARRIAGSAPSHWTPDVVARAMLTDAPDDLVLVSVAFSAVFDQTPGPAAGQAVDRDKG